ncbi:hypothetical protein ACIRP0_35230 [Streptomyces sp. NPDC101733]|uniref:hypothetical protein n=1 Tax=unclassified Streptomyces TaxID=2593676 RepID=UPI0038245434
MGSALRPGRRAWLAGGLAVPLVVALTGGPAAAVTAVPGQGAAAVASESPYGPKCAKEDGDRAAARTAAPGNAACTGPRGAKGPKGDRGPAGPPGSTGPCADIDTVAGPGTSEFSGALSKGRTYVGARATPASAYYWVDLTRARTPGYPRNACGVSVRLAGERVYVKVLTTHGDIYENSCTVTLVCTQGWTAVVKPG